MAAVGPEPGSADRQALPGVRRQLPGHRQAPRQEDRHHRDLPQAAHPRLPPARRTGHRDTRHDAAHQRGNLTARMPRRPGGGSPDPGHARSCGMSRPPGRALLTEQPGPRTHGHGCPAGYMARRRMGTCETTPPATNRGTPPTLHQQRERNPSSLPMICRRSSASSSFVLAAPTGGEVRVHVLGRWPRSVMTRDLAGPGHRVFGMARKGPTDQDGAEAVRRSCPAWREARTCSI